VAELLESLPSDVDGICRLAAAQTIHHNLRAALRLPREQWVGLPRVWPPHVAEILRELDHRIEHWLCEIRERGAWQPLDANTDFLRLHSALAVEPRLPSRHFEHAHEAWRTLRTDRSVPRERYSEESTDGESHVRAQLLQDFFSLLNHDLADVSAVRCEDSVFDELASVLADDPPPAELVSFYRATPQLRLGAAEQDPYSFVA
jgi:hypothetical protein